MNRSEAFSPFDVTEVEIHLSWPDLEICTGGTEEIQVLVSGDDISAEDLKICLDSGKLKINQPSRGINYHLTQPGWLRVTLLLPSGWKGSVEGTTVSGELSARDLSGADLSLESASGDIHAMNLSAIQLKLVSVSGDISVDQADSDTFTVRTVSGNVRIRNAGAETWRLTAVSGDIDIGMVTGFGKLNATSVSGTVRVAVPSDRVDAYIRSVSGRIRTNNISISEGAPDMKLSTVSGDLEITGSLSRA